MTPPEFADVWGPDRQRRNAAYTALMDATTGPVAWSEDVWDQVVAHLTDEDNHNRSIAAQLLCNLAAHDTTTRVLADLDALMEVTRDPRFVTARHALRSLWRIGLADGIQRTAALDALARRYRDSATEKNGTLVRSDIVESLRRLHDAVDDPRVEATARALIEEEPDPKYRTKYAAHWRRQTSTSP